MRMSAAHLAPGLEHQACNIMQHFSSSSMMYEDISYLCRPGEVNFSLDDDGVDSENANSNLLALASHTFQEQQQMQGSCPLGLAMSAPVPPFSLAVSQAAKLQASNGLGEFEVDDSTGTQLLQEMLHSQQQHPGDGGKQAGVRCATPNTSPSATLPHQERSAVSQWEDSLHVFHEMLLHQQQQQQAAAQLQEHLFGAPVAAASNSASDLSHQHGASHGHHLSGPNGPRGAVIGPAAHNLAGGGGTNFLLSSKFPGESELLSLLQLPRCAASSLPNTSFSAGRRANPGYASDGLYESGGPDALQMHPSKSGSLLQNLGFGRQSLGAVIDLDHQEKDGGMMGGLVQARDYGHPDNTQAVRVNGLASGFSFDSSLMKGNMAKAGEARGINHFATERQRREFLNEKYQTLRSLVPNPSKADRASIVADAIEYVKELKRTLQELQLLVDEKRRGGGKRQKRSEEGTPAADASETTTTSHNGSQVQAHKGQEGGAFCSDPGSLLRSSWLQRTSQHGTHVDVRIVHDEVNIKLTQRKRRKCLLDVMILLHDLHLDLLHAGGANVGEHDIYMFNTKISEGSSSIYAGFIAAKVLEAVDRPYQLR